MRNYDENNNFRLEVCYRKFIGLVKKLWVLKIIGRNGCYYMSVVYIVIIIRVKFVEMMVDNCYFLVFEYWDEV